MSLTDQEMIAQLDYDFENEPMTITECVGCKKQTLTPMAIRADNFYPCQHCRKDVFDGRDFLEWSHSRSKEWDDTETEVITPAQPPSPTAHDFLNHAGKHMDDRAVTYDSQKGERSMGKTVASFNVLTGHALTEEQGWMFMELLKKARSQQGQYRADNYEDAVAYAALRGECAAKERQPC